MSTFGPFSLGRTVASYRGVEVVRARRWRTDRFEAPVHLARSSAPKAEQRLTDAAEALAQTRHPRVARIHDVGTVGAAAFAVADPVEGLDLWSLLEHQRQRHAAPDVVLGVAVALALARIAADLADRDVWAGARGVGLSALFPAGLRLEAVVLAADGVLVRPLAGALDDPAQPTPFRAPEARERSTPANTATDVFLVAQVLRALCAGDATANAAPRMGPQTAELAPILAGGLTPHDDERLALADAIEALTSALEATAGRDPRAAIARALDVELRELAAPAGPDPEPSADDARAAALAPAPRVLWPMVRAQGPRGPGSVPAFLRDPSSSEREAVARVFTNEAAPPPDGGRIAVGPVDELGDEPTERMARPALRGGSTTTAPSDPPWAASVDVMSLEETERAPVSPAPPRVATLAEGGVTTEALSPFDDEKTE